jgi:MoaA/NifB/PqqE/SkfB family radical SAM enzyme
LGTINKANIKQMINIIKASFINPSVMIIELTNDCNADCVMCIREHLSQEPTYMDTELFKKIINQAKTLDIKVFQLSFFGEPLLVHDFGEKLSYIKEKIPGAVVVTRTNASLLSPEVALDLMKRGIDSINVSIDGNNKSEFEAIRKGLHYVNVERNIQSISKLRNAGNFDTSISISTLHTKDYPIDETKFRRKWTPWVDSIFISEEHDIRITKREGLLNKLVPCNNLLTQFLIRANGNVSQCLFDWLGNTFMGNVNDQSIYSIWHSPKFRLYRLINIFGLKKVFLYCRYCNRRFVRNSFCKPAILFKRKQQSWVKFPKI